MINKSPNRICIININWIISFCYLIIPILLFGIYSKNFLGVLDNIHFKRIFVGCYFLNYLSQTIFILTESNLIIRKPFIPFLFNKDYDLQEIELVTFKDESGKTLQPYFDIKLKNGKTCSRYTWASTEKGKLFLAELEKLGVKTEYYTNSIKL